MDKNILKKIGVPIARFFVDNGGEIISALTTSLVYSFCRSKGIHMRAPDYGYFQSYQPKVTNTVEMAMLLPRNAAESAIMTITKSGIASEWDSEKVRCAEKIFDLSANSDEDTRMFAISALNALCDATEWDGEKRRITDYVQRLGRM